MLASLKESMVTESAGFLIASLLLGLLGMFVYEKNIKPLRRHLLEVKAEAKEKIVQKDNQKDSLIMDLKNLLEQKEKENASLIKAKEEIAQKESEKALLVRDLQKVLARSKKAYTEKANEHASLVRDFEKEVAQQVNDELARRKHSQPQVDGETWQFQGDSGEWVSFPDCANKALMVKFGEGHGTCEIIIDGKTYEIDFKNSSQMNVRTKKERQIRCFFDLPAHWQMTNEDALKFFRGNLQRPPMLPVTDQDVKSRLGKILNKSLSRHDGSDCTCLHGSSNFVVTEAYQVKNLNLWRRYQRLVRSIQDKHKEHGISLEEINPSVSEALTEFARDLTVDLAGNERLLLHGTRDFELARAIATEGFDNRVARDGLFGRGTYFAAQTCKSAQYATPDGMKSKASPQMVGTMLIARVATGDPFYTEAQCSTLTRPPEKNGVRADSIIARPGIPNGQPGGVQSHMEVVTFDPAQAYPEYIVKFTEE